MGRWVLALGMPLGSATSAQGAERTLGHFIDPGAGQLTAEQVRRSFAGRTQEFDNAPAHIKPSCEPDGTIRGTVKQLSPPHAESRSAHRARSDPVSPTARQA